MNSQARQLEKLERIISFYDSLAEEHKKEYVIGIDNNLDYVLIHRSNISFMLEKTLNLWSMEEIENQTIYQHLY